MKEETISLLQETPKEMCTRCQKRPPVFKVKCVFGKSFSAKCYRLLTKFHKNAIRTDYGIVEWICVECRNQDSFLRNMKISSD